MATDDLNEMLLNDETSTNHEYRTNESVDKITLTTKVKRGEGTRDQDTIKVKVKGNNPSGTAIKLRATLDELEAEGVTEQLRETQADGDD